MHLMHRGCISYHRIPLFSFACRGMQCSPAMHCIAEDSSCRLCISFQSIPCDAADLSSLYLLLHQSIPLGLTKFAKECISFHSIPHMRRFISFTPTDAYKEWRYSSQSSYASLHLHFICSDAMQYNTTNRQHWVPYLVWYLDSCGYQAAMLESNESNRCIKTIVLNIAQRYDHLTRQNTILMYLEILRPSSLMLASFRSIEVFIAIFYFWLAMAILLSSWVAPSDFQQGENYRIIFVHVPAAWMSLLIYICITTSSVLFLLTKHPICHLFTQTGGKIGTLFTMLTLVTGCFWGKPMWGTFWVWDARLTSVLILLFIYLGALCFANISADIASIFLCIGLINIPIIKFSVNWWNTLHQPSSISQFGASIHISMLIPIFMMFAVFVLISIVLCLLEMRQFICKSYCISLSKRALLLPLSLVPLQGYERSESLRLRSKRQKKGLHFMS